MVRATFEGWLPEDFAGNVIQKVNQVSKVEATAVRIPMRTSTKRVARDTGTDTDYLAKGDAYGEDVSPNDSVILTARKFGKVVRIAEEDIDDTEDFVSILDAKKLGWAGSYARKLDNACLGVTAAIGTGVPFTSVYRAVTQADAAVGYTANANLLQTGVATAATYANFSTVLGKVETSDYYDETDLVVYAHPTFKAAFRGLLDGQGRPIFVENLGPGQSTLFNIPIHWTIGARTSATALSNPAGNPLLIVANRSYLFLGVRSGPESVVVDGRDGAAMLSDETLLKLRARRGFAVANVNAVSVLEQR